MSQFPKENITKTYSLRRRLQSINPQEKQEIDAPIIMDPNSFFEYDLSISRKVSKTDDCLQIPLTKMPDQNDDDNQQPKYNYNNINEFAFKSKLEIQNMFAQYEQIKSQTEQSPIKQPDMVQNSIDGKDTLNASLDDDVEAKADQSYSLNSVQNVQKQSTQLYDIPFAPKKRGRKKQPAEEYLKQARQKVAEIEAEYQQARLLKKSTSEKRRLRNQKTAMISRINEVVQKEQQSSVIAHQENKFETILTILQKTLQDQDKQKMIASLGTKFNKKEDIQDQLNEAFRNFYKD